MKLLTTEETGDRLTEEIVAEGKIAVKYNFGQTTIYIPKDYADKLGPERILNAIERTWTSERLKKFGGYELRRLREGTFYGGWGGTYEIELPSVLKIIKFGEPAEWDPESKIPKLVEIINRELTKL